MLVMKFGGSSVIDAAAMRRTMGIVRRYSAKPCVVVLSACGGITDILLKAAALAAEPETAKCEALLDEVETRHFALAAGLLCSENARIEANGRINAIIGHLRELALGISLLSELTPRSSDNFVSSGERLSTAIFEMLCREDGIDSILIDAARFMITDANHQNASVLLEKLERCAEKMILPALIDGKLVVTQGFIGSDGEGHTTTLGRGGSDYSAALIGAAINADEIQIWTDVNGVLTADPRLIPGCRTIPAMTFRAIRMLSFYGAKVLHPDTIKPAVDKNIPVRILNSYAPELDGTIIGGDAAGFGKAAHSIVLKQNAVYYEINIQDKINPILFLNRLCSWLVKSDNIYFLNISNTEIKFAAGSEFSFSEFIDSCSDALFIMKKADLIFVVSSVSDEWQTNENHDLNSIVEEFHSYFRQINSAEADLIIALPAGTGIDAAGRLHERMSMAMK